jgi:serine/threonine protein kinase
MMERAKPVATPGAAPGPLLRAGAQRDPWVGQAIKARYQVSRRLAAGPSGNLYIAHDGETGAEVTLKLLPVGIELDDEIVHRLRGELSVTRAVARIRPNVAIVHDCDRTASDRAFLVLEPLAGQSLADVIDQGGALPVERALRLAFEIADGLQAAHSLVLVHGALDAEQVLVGAEDTVKLTGFEVARLGGAGLDAGELTEQADIQGLGLLLIHMLTGVVRPQSEGSGARPEGMLGREVPAAIRELVMQTLVRSSEARAPDMSSMANALWVELYRVAERPVPTVQDSAPAVEPQARGPRARAPRARWRTMAIGALVVVVIALAAWAAQYRPTAPPPATSVIKAGPVRQTQPTPAPKVPKPAAVGRPAEVVVRPPVPPPLARTEPNPPKEPVVKSTPRVAPKEAPVTPRATPPVPAPAIRTPPPAPPERAQGTPRVRVTPPPASAKVTPPPPAPAERAEAPSRVPVRPAPESDTARQEPRPERETQDPSAIIDWLLKESPRQQR